jgi:hypothetical protein
VLLNGGGRPILALARDFRDIAVPAVEGLDGYSRVSSTRTGRCRRTIFQVYGYRREGGSVLLTPAKLTCRGVEGRAPAVFLDLASDMVKRGMSGGAVLNLRTGNPCTLLATPTGQRAASATP